MFRKAKTNPTSLSFDALLDLKHSIDAEIVARHDTEIATLKTRVLAVADALGVPIAELFGIRADAPSEPRRAKRAPRIKYRDPENADNTWTGKGRPPKWMQDKLDQGAQKEQFQVQ